MLSLMFIITQLLYWLSLVTFALHHPHLSRSSNNKVSIFERDGRNFTVLEHAATGVNLEFVTNSGICEITPGVNQYSGYISIGPDQYTWFWLFEARNNPKTAPLAAWFSGGPGCSSMLALFHGNGPCRFLDGESTPSLNPYSWNNNANMLYIDQPFGAGFSYSTQHIDTTDAAASVVWEFLQAFYDQFPQYESRDFGIWSESYGGHYGPRFADYLNEQNTAISEGFISGDRVNLVALGVNNGWFDSLIQVKSLIDFSYDNSYKQIIDVAERQDYTVSFENRCRPQLEACNKSGSVWDCKRANIFCNVDSGSIQYKLKMEADFDVYDIRFPASGFRHNVNAHVEYLGNESIMAAIGARSPYTLCSAIPGVFLDFHKTGDISRSFLPELSDVINAGINTVLWAGDADWVCNWVGNQRVAEAVTFPGREAFNAQKMGNYSVGGVVSGTFKTEGNLTFLRVFEAGHGVSLSKPKVALQVFEQTMKGEPLSCT